ncbi:hypothetical protein G6F37_001610 [Rhizopus arrhizus]|nr:hypothetical protein G6F38_001389 [Rhizopus arrhizus]KAG1163019.1 hypothetical protein G6F37_001610 [Rhizopus arrhizus]
MVILYSNGNNNKISLIDEPHPFDLTWRNYLPSFSQFCCCFQRQQNIRLEEDSLYQGEALQNYLDNPTDWEFETILGQNKRRNKKKKRTLDLENVYYEDAEFLADDQIHNLVYKEPVTSKEFYAAKSVPNLQFNDEASSSTLKPESSTSQALLIDLTEKLKFIQSNHIQSSSLEADQTSLHTLHIQPEEQVKSVSDIDSIIASEVLDEYENPQAIYNNDNDGFYIPSLTDNAPFASDQHPFSYIEDTTTDEGLFNLGRKIFGV